MGPPFIIPLERRQTFILESKENSAPVLRRETFEPKEEEMGSSTYRESLQTAEVRCECRGKCIFKNQHSL